MAIILLGKTRCVICGKVLQPTDEIVGFPVVFPNEADPLHLLNDAAVHAVCLRDHPLRQAVEKRMAEYRQKTGPGNRYCRVCGREILNSHDYLGFGHLTDDPTSPLSQYNYAHFHRSCFRDWPEGPHVVSLLETMVETGAWRGEGLPAMIKHLKDLLSSGKAASGDKK
jgi:hypothetical protein